MRTDVGKCSFVNRTIADWNRLPERAIGTSLVKTDIFRKSKKQATWQPHKPHKTTQLTKKHMRKTTKAHGYHMYSP
jgi:hypothetical protein